MSTMQRQTLIGYYNYDPTLFDNLTLPEGYDKELFINTLLLEHGEKLVLYSNPDFMKGAIGIWCKKWENELKRIYTALTAEYNPIHNYDRNEEYTDTEGIKSSAGHKATNSPDYTSENTISADNASAYQPDRKNEVKGKTSDLSETSNGKTDRTLQHYAHLYGNIGVTTSVQMWTEEVKARMEFNLYDTAGRIFANELLIGIY